VRRELPGSRRVTLSSRSRRCRGAAA
jgi:hypothetical protein